MKKKENKRKTGVGSRKSEAALSIAVDLSGAIKKQPVSSIQYPVPSIKYQVSRNLQPGTCNPELATCNLQPKKRISTVFYIYRSHKNGGNLSGQQAIRAAC